MNKEDYLNPEKDRELPDETFPERKGESVIADLPVSKWNEILGQDCITEDGHIVKVVKYHGATGPGSIDANSIKFLFHLTSIEYSNGVVKFNSSSDNKLYKII